MDAGAVLAHGQPRHRDAQAFYGHLLLFRGQGFGAREEGLRLLRLAASAGDGKSAYQLGVQALKGDSRQAPDALAASRHWALAAEAGHPLAARKLAELYRDGGRAWRRTASAPSTMRNGRPRSVSS